MSSKRAQAQLLTRNWLIMHWIHVITETHCRSGNLHSHCVALTLQCLLWRTFYCSIAQGKHSVEKWGLICLSPPMVLTTSVGKWVPSFYIIHFVLPKHAIHLLNAWIDASLLVLNLVCNHVYLLKPSFSTSTCCNPFFPILPYRRSSCLHPRRKVVCVLPLTAV